jgi:hypothetical protein
MIISGIVRGEADACVRSITYGQLISELKAGWTSDGSGPYADGISAQALEELSSKKSSEELLGALTHPQISDDRYRISPLLWMGDPAKPDNCLWKTGNG